MKFSIDLGMDLEQNKEYKRTVLHQYFGGQRQGGISTPKNGKVILLFTGEEGEQYGYKDGWTEDGIFNYTGEGQIGDMKFVRGNLAVRDHAAAGKELLLFSYVGRGKVRFINQMMCTGYHTVPANDRDGHIRGVIVFELVPAANFSQPEESEIPPEISKLSLEELRKKALDKPLQSQSPKERKATYYQRSEAIKLYVRRRANGACEGCGAIAPFVTATGDAYLEAHHIKRVSDGGPDHPAWVVAICPNCHRRAHYSKDAEEYNQQLRSIALAKETNYRS